MLVDRLVEVDGGERPDRAGPRGGARVRRRQGRHRPDRHRQLRRRRHARSRTSPRTRTRSTRRSTRSPSRRTRRSGTASCAAAHLFDDSTLQPNLHRVLRRRGQRLHRHRRAGPGGGHRRRRHALRGRRGEPRVRPARRRSPRPPGGAAVAGRRSRRRRRPLRGGAADPAQAVRHHLRVGGRRRRCRSRSRSPSATPATPRSTCSGSNQEGAASLAARSGRGAVGPGFLRSTGRPRHRPRLWSRWRSWRSPSASAASFFGSDGSLRQALRPYAEGYVAEPEFDDDDGGDGKGQQLAQTPLLQRAVEATGQLRREAGLPHQGRVDARAGQPPAAPGRGAVLLRRRRRRSSRCCSSRWPTASIAALIGVVIVALIPPAILSYLGQPPAQAVRGAAARHAPAAGQHAAGRLLAHAGRRGGVAGGVRADGPGAASGRHRGSARPPARGGARRRRRAAWTPATSPGR